jgi:AraC-like DNA-binding protein
MRHAATVLESALAGDCHNARTAGFDLVAANDDRPYRHCDAPIWLARLREELEDFSLARIDVAARAKEAGAHPAHASRLFRRCFGASITEHAQAQSVRRAIASLASGATLSDAALAAGFYDQSHMNRVFRRVTGRTPGAHRAMLAMAVG